MIRASADHDPAGALTGQARIPGGMVILFLHGMESTPGGKKPSYFCEHGHTVLNPALPADDFERSLEIAQASYNEGRPDLVVGSSRGGAVALNIETGSTPRLLLCPAWKKWGTATSLSGPAIIIHSRGDEVIPFALSQELAAASPKCRLVEAGSDHRMADADTLALMLRLAEELAALKGRARGHGMPRFAQDTTRGKTPT